MLAGGESHTSPLCLTFNNNKMEQPNKEEKSTTLIEAVTGIQLEFNATLHRINLFVHQKQAEINALERENAVLRQKVHEFERKANSTL